MPSWGEWRAKDEKSQEPLFLDRNLKEQLATVSKLCQNSDVVFYGTGFLQHPGDDRHAGIVGEDINGFMEVMESLPGGKLVLILHTPGGEVNAVDHIVGYLHSRYDEVTAIVPCMAMSGGSMISLASNRIIMGAQSQIGPIDPQLPFYGELFSALDVLRVKEYLTPETRHRYAGFFQSAYPVLIPKAERALDHGENLLRKWLRDRMLKDETNAKKKARHLAGFFNARSEDGEIYAHGQRIAIDTLREQGVKVEKLESKPQLQEAVMNAYHLMTLMFELTDSMKIIANQRGDMWVKALSANETEDDRSRSESQD